MKGRAGQGRAGQGRAEQGRGRAELTGRQISRSAIRLKPLIASKVSLVASHLLEVAQELDEADHAVLVGVRLLHLCAQRLGRLLVLHQWPGQTLQ